MADADITIKDSAGVDRKIDSRTVGAGVDEHRQVFAIGDPTTAANVVAVNAAGALSTTPQRPATSAVASVASSAASVTLQAANANRLGLTIFNDSTALLYVKFGTTASATSYTVQVTAGGYYEAPFDYTGRVDGIWASANGFAYSTELTA